MHSLSRRGSGDVINPLLRMWDWERDRGYEPAARHAVPQGELLQDKCQFKANQQVTDRLAVEAIGATGKEQLERGKREVVEDVQVYLIFVRGVLVSVVSVCCCSYSALHKSN